MSSLSQRLVSRLEQRQTLTPSLVQMVRMLQLNRLELKDMLIEEISLNPALANVEDEGEELTPEEVQAQLETEREAEPADQSILDVASGPADAKSPADPFEEIDFGTYFNDYLDPGYKTPASENTD